ncbi:hypothetical protein D9619_008334 [Psilocybe cf. subviscida]|uniref:Uncharacterized protein n=1 Tax=Psilocybe cf. subviscida TaxID=2480587 RepID=A0A8H5BAA7_9AGAR|nr:hypothetical protein D9619_008334 [Psilocybe cf. subviscida]
MAFGIAKVTLVSICVESILYGFLLVIFLLTEKIIRKRHTECPSTRSVNLKMLCILVTMFIGATIHLGTSLARLLCAFIETGVERNDGITLDYQKLIDVNTPANILRIVVYEIQTLVGDAFIIYRLHLVWNGNKFLLYPLVLASIASLVAAVGSVQAVARSHTESTSKPILGLNQGAWVVLFFALTVFTNISASGSSAFIISKEDAEDERPPRLALIAGRIWWVPLNVTQMTMPGAQCDWGHTRLAILESGALYGISLIVLMALYIKGLYPQNVVLDAMPQVIGIAFSLIIARVVLGVSRANAIKSQSAQIQQLNLSVKNMLESQKSTLKTQGMESWHSGSTQMFKEGRENEFIACEVEVIQSNDTESVGGESGQIYSDRSHALMGADRNHCAPGEQASYDCGDANPASLCGEADRCDGSLSPAPSTVHVMCLPRLPSPPSAVYQSLSFTSAESQGPKPCHAVTSLRDPETPLEAAPHHLASHSARSGKHKRALNVQFTGPALIGYMLNCILFGALAVQVYLYTLSFPNDRPFFKCLVLGIFVIEAAQTMFLTHDIFDSLAAGWGDLSEASRVHWAWFDTPIMGGIGEAGLTHELDLCCQQPPSVDTNAR